MTTSKDTALPIHLYISDSLRLRATVILRDVPHSSFFSSLLQNQIGRIYKFIMLSLSNLTLILVQPNTRYITNKELKISSGTATSVTKSVPRSSKDGQIIWDDVLMVPNSGAVNFEIVSKHQFGYNPEELSSVIQGSIKVGDKLRGSEQKLITAQVYDLLNQKVGYLKANIRLGLNPKQEASNPLVSSQLILPKQQKILLPSSTLLIPQERPKQNEYLLIQSVIAHVDSVKGKTIFLKFLYGGSQVTSQNFTSKSGEIVYISTYELKSPERSADSQLKVQLYDGEAQMGTGAFFVDSLGKVTKKGTLKDSQGRELGDIFLEGKIISKSNRYGNRSMLEMSYSQLKESPSGSLLKSSVNLKRSIVNSNTNIMFSKEMRFFGNLEDKKNPYVSYQSPGTLEFKQSRSKKYYRGASIGRGEKHDFTSNGRGRPGVGEYFLPTIWDRY